MRLKHFVPMLILSILPLSSFAAIIHDEAIDGNFSSDRTTPTSLSLAAGSNQIFGSNGNLDPRDYVTFSVPVGYALTAITLLDTALGNKGFLGLEAGNQITIPATPPPATAAGLLGWWHYTPADKNTDLLALMSVPSNGSSGFITPLAAGTYSLWIQDTSVPAAPTTSFFYGLDLQLTPTPEPATWQTAFLGIAVAGAWIARRR